MPLHLKLRRGEKLLVNGAVLELGQRFGEVVIHNQSYCLRGSELLTEAEATTPTRRLYFAVQMMIVEPQAKDRHRALFDVLYDQLVEAFVNQDIRARLEEIRAEVDQDHPYRGLSLMRAVLKYEDLVMARAKLDNARRIEREAHAAGAGREARLAP